MKTQTKTNLLKLLKKENIYLYKDDSVFDSMPQGEADSIEYFNLGKYISDDELEKEYESRGLTPVDPVSFIENQVKENKHKYTTTHWKDADGKWCFAVFDLWDVDKRSVLVGRDDYGWDDRWWFGGVRKSTSISETKLSSDTLTLKKAVELCKEAGYVVYKKL